MNTCYPLYPNTKTTSSGGFSRFQPSIALMSKKCEEVSVRIIFISFFNFIPVLKASPALISKIHRKPISPTVAENWV